MDLDFAFFVHLN